MTRFLVLALCALAAFPPAAGAGKRAKARPDSAATTSTTVPAPAHLFGYNDSAVQSGQLDATAHAALARDGGASVQRVTFDWRWAEPQRGVLRLDAYDRLYAAYTAAGIRPVFVVVFAPQWAWAEGTPCVQAMQDCRYPPADLAAWRGIVRTLAARYPQLAAIEVWNEPNMRGFWQSGADPAHYATLVKEASAAVRGLGSTIPVLGGSVTVTADGEAGSMGVREFLAGMYAAGVKGAMDGLAVHPYPSGPQQHKTFRTLTTARDVRDAHGDVATPLWVTEVGFSSTNLGTSVQARLLARLYERYRSAPDIRATIVHSLVPQAESGMIEAGMGMVGLDLALKPAYCALAAANGVAQPCVSAPVAIDDAQEERWRAQDLVQAAADAARRYRAQTGSYAGLTAARLHELDPRLSAGAATTSALPGPDADPSRIGVFVWGAASEHLEVCNTSTQERSYCIHNLHGSYWDYGSYAGTINQAAGATNNRTSTTW